MALEAPLRSSTGALQFPFGYTGEMSAPQESESLRSPLRPVSSPPPLTDSSSLRPGSVQRVSSNSMHIMSPTDIVGPSPVTSNGTETTEIEDDASEDIQQDTNRERRSSSRSELLMLTTNLPDNLRQSSGEEAVSVIHAPESFSSWASTESANEHDRQNRPSRGSSPQSSDKSSSAVRRTSIEVEEVRSESPAEHPFRPPISTDVKPVRYSIDSATPRAQDLQDMLNDDNRLRSSSTSSLEKIDEQTEAEGDEDDYISDANNPMFQEDETTVLRTAFQETWALCNTLANLSSIHRSRVFNTSGTPDAHKKAWKTCWKMCQQLYDDQDEDVGSLNVRHNLELCRDFCQALFDIRHKRDENADSVLRVSFELNNHLYSAQDSRNLPEEFRERTLDFYITLCHRLMKQRGDFGQETDQLLRACWALAEMLFNLRQNRRDGKPPDEELLGSAVQSCWDLCDMFRGGCTQVRSDRNTPQPTQSTFFSPPPTEHSGRESRTSNRSHNSKRESTKASKPMAQEERTRKPPVVPETPVTEFEDTPISPESRSPQMPNIMVLGKTSGDSGRGARWSSGASNLSSYSQGSNRTSSTATTTATTEEPNIMRCKVLVLRAAMLLGFSRDKIQDAKAGAASLQKFVQTLPTGSFGSLPSHATLLQHYKNSVLTDAIIPRSQVLPASGKRVSAVDVAKSVQTMCKSSQRYTYLRDLFGFVFQFPIEEVDTRRNVNIVV